MHGVFLLFFLNKTELIKSRSHLAEFHLNLGVLNMKNADRSMLKETNNEFYEGNFYYLRHGGSRP
jgi:hypothetical protein